MNNTTRQKWLRRKRRIAKKTPPAPVAVAGPSRCSPPATSITTWPTATRAIAHGGIGAVHLLARKVGLIDAIDREVQLLKVHLPYHESDHVLNIAYNILCDGDCLQDLERLRNDEAYLDALGTSAHSRSHHGRRLLPALRVGRSGDRPDGSDQLRARRGVEAAAGRSSSTRR